MATWPSIDAFLLARGIQFGAPTLGQTTGGSHVVGSEHYLGRARDYGDANSNTKAISAALAPLAQGAGYQVEDLYDGAHGVWFKDGEPFTPTAALRLSHMDHVHVSLRPGVSLGAVSTPELTLISSTTAVGGTGTLSSLTSHQTATRAAKVVGGFGLLVFGLVSGAL